MPRNDYFEAWLRNKTATSSKWSMNLNEKTLILQNLEYTYDGVLHSENLAFEYADRTQAQLEQVFILSSDCQRSTSVPGLAAFL